MKTKQAWSNFRTGKTDYLLTPPADYRDYMPQYEAAFGLYDIYQELGDSPLHAYLKVMLKIAGTIDRID